MEAGVLTRLVRTTHWWRERRGGDRPLSCGAGFRPGNCWPGRGLWVVARWVVTRIGGDKYPKPGESKN